jgi:hypothetical protein
MEQSRFSKIKNQQNCSEFDPTTGSLVEIQSIARGEGLQGTPVKN